MDGGYECSAATTVVLVQMAAIISALQYSLVAITGAPVQ